MQQGTIIIFETLKKKMRGAIQDERRGMLAAGVVLLHDNAGPNTDSGTRALLGHFNSELFGQFSYSPDLALSDYHLFTYLKSSLRKLRVP
jgi:hypothetical protein